MFSFLITHEILSTHYLHQTHIIHFSFPNLFSSPPKCHLFQMYCKYILTICNVLCSRHLTSCCLLVPPYSFRLAYGFSSLGLSLHIILDSTTLALLFQHFNVYSKKPREFNNSCNIFFRLTVRDSLLNIYNHLIQQMLIIYMCQIFHARCWVWYWRYNKKIRSLSRWRQSSKQEVKIQVIYSVV